MLINARTLITRNKSEADDEVRPDPGKGDQSQIGIRVDLICREQLQLHTKYDLVNCKLTHKVPDKTQHSINIEQTMCDVFGLFRCFNIHTGNATI